jgi:uncharacterized membrane protein
MNRFLRMFKHRWLDTEDAHRALGEGTLERLRERVRDSETRHTGEIRICVEAGLPMSYLWRNAAPRERAITMFGKLGVWDTEHNNGVLIYLLVADHAIELVADRAIHQHVDAQQWQTIVQGMSAAFKSGQYEDGLNAAVDAVTRLLVQHFPATPGQRNPNELPDSPHVR